MIHVFLDDLRSCPKGFVLARNAEECLLLLQECEVDVLSLDYDLGWDQPTGMSVVNQIILNRLYPQRIFLHTSSLEGKQKMFQALYANKPEHVQLMNGPMPPETLMKVAESIVE